MKDSLSFAVLTDIHLTDAPPRSSARLARDSVRIFEETREDVEALHLDYVLYTGDLFEARHLALPQLELAKRTLEKTATPWFVLAGNHDSRYKTTQDSYDTQDFIKAFEGHGPSGSRAYWSYDVPDSPFVFVGIQTAQKYTSDGRVDPEQLAWLRKELVRCADRYVIAFMHHPAVVFDKLLTELPDMSVYYLRNHEEVRDLLAANPCVKLVVSGHNHTRRHQAIDGLHFVGCPSINSWPNMYAAFRVSAKRIGFEFRQIRDRAMVQEAYAGLIDPESSQLKTFGDSGKVTAYYAAAPANAELTPRS
jgi:3',5'-cyclic AMP phosphodiesterase CpdA